MLMLPNMLPFVTPLPLRLRSRGQNGRQLANKLVIHLSPPISKRQALPIYKTTRALLPPPEAEQRDDQGTNHQRNDTDADSKPTSNEASNEASNDTSNDASDDLLDDLLDPSNRSRMDQLAAQWIGTDLARWEWYERLKSRRDKMDTMLAESEARFDADVEDLRTTLMELDDVLGTNMTDEKSEITPAGWASVVLLMLAYLGIGYAIIQAVWHVVIILMRTNSFP